MASTMDAATPTRRVLGDLNVNTPSARSSISGRIHNDKTSSPSKSSQMGKAYTSISHQFNNYQKNGTEASMGGQKRIAPVTDENFNPTPKRRRSQTEVVEIYGLDGSRKNVPSVSLGPEENQSHGNFDVPTVPTRAISPSQNVYGEHSDVSSPNSSISLHAGLNNSQNTILTEPDEAPSPTKNRPQITFESFLPSQSRQLSRQEIRENAKLLKLRLRLANYKVKTNQINVPMSRLQIRPSGCSPNLSPALPANLAESQASIPSLSNIPHISLEEPSSEQIHNDDDTKNDNVDIPSSPPQYHTPHSENDKPASPVKGSCTPYPTVTPLLPRQHQSISHPPALGSLAWNDLPSSAVQGRAAGGLLSLMHRQE